MELTSYIGLRTFLGLLIIKAVFVAVASINVQVVINFFQIVVISVIINSQGSLRESFGERHSNLTSKNDGFDANPYRTCSLIFYLHFFKQKRILKTQCKYTPSAGVSVVGRRT